jgi:hypothetical protein
MLSQSMSHEALSKLYTCVRSLQCPLLLAKSRSKSQWAQLPIALLDMCFAYAGDRYLFKKIERTCRSWSKASRAGIIYFICSLFMV